MTQPRIVSNKAELQPELVVPSLALVLSPAFLSAMKRREVVSLSSEYIFRETERLHRRYGTRDPYELLSCMGAEIHYTHEFGPDGLKGYCTVLKRIKFAVINAFLNEFEQRVVAGHEAAHLVLHMNEIYRSPVRALKDFHMFTETGRIEYEANLFLADFMLSDDEVMESVSDDENNFFSSASEFYVPPDLFAFKLFSMSQRNYKVQSPIIPDSKFLGS